ncbi:hypothetical protein MMC17_000633 [Xylographa soralifera]|nr:hypothetical protein [Xylographa soralifera]
MAAPPTERQRANTAGDYPIDATSAIEKYPAIVRKFPPERVVALHAAAAREYATVASRVLGVYGQLASIEAAKVIDLDHHSKTAWKAINVVEYRSNSGSRQYRASFDVQSTVVDCIKAISKHCPIAATFRTKQGAVETLRKRGNTICLSGGDTIGYAVIRYFQYNSVHDDTMLGMLEITEGKEGGFQPGKKAENAAMRSIIPSQDRTRKAFVELKPGLKLEQLFHAEMYLRLTGQPRQ